MRLNAISAAVLTCGLVVAVAMRFFALGRTLPSPEILPELLYKVVGGYRLNVEGVERIDFQAPWCPQPVGMVLIPAYLSAIDLHVLPGPDGEFIPIFYYAGHRLPSVGTGALLTVMHFYYRLESALRLPQNLTSTGYLLKLFVPASCRGEVEEQISSLTSQLADLRSALHTSGSPGP